MTKQFTNCSWQPFVGRPGQLREIEASWPGPALESIANPPAGTANWRWREPDGSSFVARFTRRALRDQSRPTGQFAYFDIQLGHPNWEGKSVLDYGGNRGNLLLNPDCVIRHEQYYCMDVLQGAIDEGRERFPKARWVHYNRYNCSFNPEGIEGLPVPDLGIRFDFILAFSVFTHTTREELHDLVGQLRSRLAPGGTLAFTFIDPHFRSWRKLTLRITCNGVWKDFERRIALSMSMSCWCGALARPGVLSWMAAKYL